MNESASASAAAPAFGAAWHLAYRQDPVGGGRQVSDRARLAALDLVAAEADGPVDWQALLLPEDRGRFRRAVEEVWREGGSGQLEYRVRSRSGRVIEVRDFFGRLPGEGGWPVLSGCVLSAEHSPARIRQMERLILAGRLMGGLVHDFRNLLAGIQNMVEWCTSQSVNENVRKGLRKTVSYTDQANSMINSTLRLIGGKTAGQPEPIAMATVLADMRELLPHCLGSAVEIVCTADNELPPILGERGAIMDMLLNLSLNARDAMPGSGGRLQLHAGAATMPGDDARRAVRLVVADNGCGMSEAQLARIFQEFYSTKPDGIGLGLWMVREAVRGLAGELRVTSSPGEGSTFELFFPATDRQAPAPIAPVPVGGEELAIEPFHFADAPTILFIEDDPLLNNSVATWLEALGFDLLVADSGSRGWELFAANAERIDCVIQDFILPGVRGDDLLERFKQRRPELPVIVVSGYPDGREEQWLLEKGAFAFLAKPFKIERLVQLLRRVFPAGGPAESSV